MHRWLRCRDDHSESGPSKAAYSKGPPIRSFTYKKGRPTFGGQKLRKFRPADLGNFLALITHSGYSGATMTRAAMCACTYTGRRLALPCRGNPSAGRGSIPAYCAAASASHCPLEALHPLHRVSSVHGAQRFCLFWCQIQRKSGPFLS